jgi:dUTP pyrophosphatase
MKDVALFEKVSFEQFYKQFLDDYYSNNSKIFFKEDLNKDNLKLLYNEIILPKRKTKYSAGYDFHMPFTITIPKYNSVVIPTGIRCKIREDYVLQIYPRSSLGFKHGIRLSNGVAIIDSDYYNADNEGHIMIKLSNDSANCKDITLEKGSGFCQGLFIEYGTTINDDADGIRTGGIGSTDK